MDADAKERIAKSTQEQAVAAWTHWLNEEVQKKVDGSKKFSEKQQVKIARKRPLNSGQ